jgi:hypothetical protein
LPLARWRENSGHDRVLCVWKRSKAYAVVIQKKF